MNDKIEDHTDGRALRVLLINKGIWKQIGDAWTDLHKSSLQMSVALGHGLLAAKKEVKRFVLEEEGNVVSLKGEKEQKVWTETLERICKHYGISTRKAHDSMQLAQHPTEVQNSATIDEALRLIRAKLGTGGSRGGQTGTGQSAQTPEAKHLKAAQTALDKVNEEPKSQDSVYAIAQTALGKMTDETRKQFVAEIKKKEPSADDLQAAFDLHDPDWISERVVDDWKPVEAVKLVQGILAGLKKKEKVQPDAVASMEAQMAELVTTLESKATAPN
jgi:hypothetical protein